MKPPILPRPLHRPRPLLLALITTALLPCAGGQGGTDPSHYVMDPSLYTNSSMHRGDSSQQRLDPSQYRVDPPQYRVDPSEYRHRGELHLARGGLVYSLAWVVELRPSCSVAQLLGHHGGRGGLWRRSEVARWIEEVWRSAAMNSESYRKNKENEDLERRKDKHIRNNISKYNDKVHSSVHYNRTQTKTPTNNQHRKDKPKLSTQCPRDTAPPLVLVRSIPQFTNVHIIAHPYFKIFYQERKKIHRRIKRHLQCPTPPCNVARKLSQGVVDRIDRHVFQRVESCVESYLKQHPCVVLARQEVLRTRRKRSRLEFNDPLYRDQWHLHSQQKGQYDINVEGAWESGITGRGVTVCVIDDGLEWQHPDLRDNYNPAGSYDLNADDPDPSPVKNGERNEHGTRCAGEIAAVANSMCGVGVAYRANISGIRVLGGRMTDSMEAAAFIQGLDVNDIYSCSWGPDDDGRTVDGPHHLASRALEHGVTYGRKGYGAIYVVASGNGGRQRDNCNFDGYANSVYTVTIGAVDIRGQMPYYAEECAAMLAVMPSSGSGGHGIVTTDWRENSASGCTRHHSGTSAAAPLAAAVVALALEVQPCLSWRDVQYIIALTSRKIDVANSDWSDNGAKLHHSHQHGFGLMDATAVVSAAAVWESVPFSTTFTSTRMAVGMAIPPERLSEVTVEYTVTDDLLEGYALSILEFVQVRVTVKHQYRGSLRISLVCPSGTRSILATPRDADNSSKGLQDWPLGSVRCWGEDPRGTYQLSVTHTRHQLLRGKLVAWQLVLHGCSMTPAEMRHRKSMVERAARGEVVHVNRTQLCHPPELRFEPFQPLPERWLKVLIITGFFFLFMTVFNSIEYILCYNDEKEKFYKKLKDLSAGRAMSQRSPAGLRVIGTSDQRYGSMEGGQLQPEGAAAGGAPTNEVLPLMTLDRASPTLSCDADVSSMNGDSDEDNLSSHCTSDTVVPKDTDATDFTNDEFMSELDDERKGPDYVKVI